MTLARRRGVGEILRDALALYGARWRTYLLLALVVAAPVQLLVSGVGLGDLGAPYDDTPRGQDATLIVAGASQLVTTPLVTAMVIAVLLAERPLRARRAIQSGLDLFAPLLLVSLLYVLLGSVGLLLLVIPGVIVLVRLYVFAQAVVLDGLRGGEALRRSWALTAGSFWRVLAIAALVYLVVVVVTALAATPFTALAESTGSRTPLLAGSIVAEAIGKPYVAIATTLLYLDLRARAEPTTATAS